MGSSQAKKQPLPQQQPTSDIRYHYTTWDAFLQILRTNKLIKSQGGKDACFGPGVYFTHFRATDHSLEKISKDSFGSKGTLKRSKKHEVCIAVNSSCPMERCHGRAGVYILKDTDFNSLVASVEEIIVCTNPQKRLADVQEAISENLSNESTGFSCIVTTCSLVTERSKTYYRDPETMHANFPCKRAHSNGVDARATATSTSATDATDSTIAVASRSPLTTMLSGSVGRYSLKHIVGGSAATLAIAVPVVGVTVHYCAPGTCGLTAASGSTSAATMGAAPSVSTAASVASMGTATVHVATVSAATTTATATSAAAAAVTTTAVTATATSAATAAVTTTAVTATATSAATAAVTTTVATSAALATAAATTAATMFVGTGASVATVATPTTISIPTLVTAAPLVAAAVHIIVPALVVVFIAGVGFVCYRWWKNHWGKKASHKMFEEGDNVGETKKLSKKRWFWSRKTKAN